MRSRTPDRLCAEAVDVALTVTQEAVGAHSVGEHLGVVAEGDRVVTHLFACKEPAYRGWQWATTLTRASRAKAVTIDETVLLPGPDAVLAPEWVPWNERLRPGDMGPGDLLPTDADDLRLLRQIQTLQAFGFELEETRPFVDCLRAGHSAGDTCAASLAVYRRKLAELDAMVARLRSVRAEVASQLVRAELEAAGEGGPMCELGAVGAPLTGEETRTP